MSTFKRLFNVGKGKARVARRDAGEALDPAELLESARHRAADAAEAMADAIRPAPAAQPVEPVRATRRAADPAAAPAEDDAVVEDAEEVAEDIRETRGSGPRKRTL